MLPLSVLEQAQAELLNYGGTGMSVMEMSHRSGRFLKAIQRRRGRPARAAGHPRRATACSSCRAGRPCSLRMLAMNLAARRPVGRLHPDRLAGPGGA